MTGLHVTVPVACWRKGLAREYLETEEVPPPATCYGFLLSLVGEIDRRRHVGCRVTAGLLSRPEKSVVLRTVWRVKKTPLGSAGNTRPDYQQLLSGIELVMWLDSVDEATGPTLEDRVRQALDPVRRGAINRFGGLSLGESAHLIDSVSLIDRVKDPPETCRLYLLDPAGRLTLPVWVDHVGSAGTMYVVGNLQPSKLSPPAVSSLPKIVPTA
jgi:CRISPR-associated protein Cas5t